MAEFIIFALFVMVPVFLLIPALGKMSDMNQKTIQAARYSAWERTISSPSTKPETTVTTEARLRFFARNNKYIQTGEAVREQNSDRSYFWRATGSRNYNPMLAQFSDANSAIATTSAGPVRGAFVAADFALNVPTLSSRDFAENYDIYTASMSMPVATNPDLEPLHEGTDCAGANSNTVFMCINRQNAIYTDTWNAGDRNQVIARVEDMVPTSRLRWVENVLRPLSWIPFGLFDEVTMLDMGIVEPDVLPGDRLGQRTRYNP